MLYGSVSINEVIFKNNMVMVLFCILVANDVCREVTNFAMAGHVINYINLRIVHNMIIMAGMAGHE